MILFFVPSQVSCRCSVVACARTCSSLLSLFQLFFFFCNTKSNWVWEYKKKAKISFQELVRAPQTPVHKHVGSQHQPANWQGGGETGHVARECSFALIERKSQVLRINSQLCQQPCAILFFFLHLRSAPLQWKRTRRPLPLCLSPRPRWETWTLPTMPVKFSPPLPGSWKRAPSRRTRGGTKHRRPPDKLRGPFLKPTPSFVYPCVCDSEPSQSS